MESFEILKMICAGATIVLGLIGCFLLHYRLRTGPSLTFLASVIALNAWIPLYNFVSGYTLSSASIPGENRYIILMHHVNDLLVPVLMLLASVCFVLSTLRIVRPNNSFKPSPLRGPA